MTKTLRIASLVATAAAVALTAVPASAASPTQQATAKVNIKKPVAISWVADMNFGDIVLSGPAGFTTTVTLDAATGALACDATKVTCSGDTAAAEYNVRGSQGAIVTLDIADTLTLTNANDDELTLEVDAPDVITLSNSGTGDNFTIGGSLDLAANTPDGEYMGTFLVTANY